jgi:hypothetical protein
MANSVPADEPSMEEILASIRRIISDDDPVTASEADAVVPAFETSEPEETVEPHPLSGVDTIVNSSDDGVDFQVDLSSDVPATSTSMAADQDDTAQESDITKDERAFDLDGEAEIVEPVESDLAFASDTDESESEPTAEVETLELTVAQIAEVDAPKPSIPALDGESRGALLSDAVGSQVSDMLQSLAPRPASAGAAGSQTIDDLVREMMRPMLRDWLDNNLPGMVERLVKQEIQRLTRSQ